MEKIGRKMREKSQSGSRSPSKQRSRDRNGKEKWTEQKYDQFLLTEKKGTFKRLDPFEKLSTPIRHQCNNCHRIWKPSPKKCLPQDYFCPSCALHHRNNISRFQQPRFSWTAGIPNTFYLYRIVDEKTKFQFYKYGRTQHQKPDSRYSSTQRKRYEMVLQCSFRGSLKNMTAIENLWKRLANEEGIRPEFSEKEFHGATECILLNNELLKQMKQISQMISKLDHNTYTDYTLKDLQEGRRKRVLDLVQEIRKTI